MQRVTMETGIRRDAETRERRRVPCYRITGGSTEYTISTLSFLDKHLLIISYYVNYKGITQCPEFYIIAIHTSYMK